MTGNSTVAMIEDYLRLCEERKLPEAARYLSTGARLVFPGGSVFTDLNDLVADSATRYRSVRKTRQHYLLGTREGDGAELCTSLGTLEGTTLWGTEFTGVRYIDVFVIRDGLIQEQLVWNDLAEIGAVPNQSQRAQGRP